MYRDSAGFRNIHVFLLLGLGAVRNSLALADALSTLASERFAHGG